MQSTQSQSHGTQPPPQASSKTGHPLPRRTSPANSITLKHHRLAHEASLRADRGSSSVAPQPQQPPAAAAKPTLSVSSPRRNSSGDSYDTSRSDPRKWFDQSNQNPTATFDNNTMDIDPPFFQKETDSSNEGKIYSYDHPAPSKLTRAHSSSADDYRSVIDDLTIEIHRLKEELKRYKQLGPDMLRKEKLFEIKVHGLPSRKKRELEATLRDFASSLDGSNGASSTNNNKKHESPHSKRDRMYSAASGSMSKHASSSSGSRPADSAYASMSTGANSSGTSLGRQSMKTQGGSSEQKVQSYLRDIPEGLYPRHMAMTDKERKKLVVRRLEQLFTGKIGGRHVQRKQSNAVPAIANLAPVMSDIISQPGTKSGTAVHQPPSLLQHEPSREAKILPREQQSTEFVTKSRSRDNASASNSNEDQTESSGNAIGSGSGTNPSPPMASLPEQRPTRPKDLDPDRVQVPSENMDYIRHLGLIPPELLERQYNFHDVHPDADGWVYLNLLCNMAQLHMINVTPDFVRLAVSEISTKFQLSPDGRKIRWRGGTEGTKFSSDSSGYNSQKSPSTDDTDGSTKDGRKRKKTGRSTDEKPQSGSSSKIASKSGPQVSTSSGSFHYKPLFAHQDSTGGQTSLEDTVSSFGPAEDSNIDVSRYGVSGSGSSARRKRRRDGAIIYYNGAPFCTDLSGDPGDVSPTAHLAAGVQQSERRFARPHLRRSESGSLINYKPLSARGHLVRSNSELKVDGTDGRYDSMDDDDDNVSEIELDLCWSGTPQFLNFRTLEPCGIGGVLPEDHFMVVVSTNRPREDARHRAKSFDERATSPEGTDAVIRRLATMSTSSPVLAATKPASYHEPLLEIEYTSGRIKRLAPVALPPPGIFFPPFSTDESASTDWMSGSDEDIDVESSNFLIQQLQPPRSHDYPDNVDLSSGDEEGEEPDDSPEGRRMYDVDGNGQVSVLESQRRRASGQSSSAAAAAGTMRSKSTSADPMIRTDRSSVATAGVAESGYNSGEEGEEEDSSDSS